MSVQSGGGIPPTNVTEEGIPLELPDDPNARKRREICRKKDFELTCLPPVDTNTVINVIIDSVNPPEDLDSIQQINNKKYVISFKTTESAEKFLRSGAPNLQIPGTKSECRWLGAEHKKLKIAYLPAAVANSALESFLKNYGTVLQIVDEMHTDTRVPLKTGTRIVDFLMAYPVPNIITVNGFSVPVVYRGVKIQCRRCQQLGHIKADCYTEYCYRCKTFGHDEESCTAPCLKCKSDHHWKECTVRSYSFAVSSETAVATSAAATSGAPAILETNIPTRTSTEPRSTEQQETTLEQQTMNGDNRKSADSSPNESITGDSVDRDTNSDQSDRELEKKDEDDKGVETNNQQGEGSGRPNLRKRNEKRKEITPQKEQPDPKKPASKTNQTK